MHVPQCSLLLFLIVVGCGEPSSPPQHIQAWVDSWAEMGMYLPDEEQVAFLHVNLSDVTPELAAALSNTNPDVRQRAAYVIAEIGPDAVSLGPALFERLKNEPDQLVQIYIVDALAAVKFSNDEIIAFLEEKFESLSSDNAPPNVFGGDYAEVDEKISLAAALFVLTEPSSRDQYLNFVVQWLHPPNSEMNIIETAGYWERRWMAVISLEGMSKASDAIPLLESMLNEENAQSWVSVHVPRVLGVLRASGS